MEVATCIYIRHKWVGVGGPPRWSVKLKVTYELKMGKTPSLNSILIYKVATLGIPPSHP